MRQMDTTFLIDDYVNTKMGEPYRLFPFGKIVKNGKTREITPEYAQKFKLPHFKPPVKLGSHEDETPAGGHIVGLEVREDGLYAVPEWNDKGSIALSDGSYRYHSPEVIWDDAGLEDPTNGNYIMGPLILGDAMLHTPHLGEATALYSIEPVTKEKDMATENISVPAGLWDTFTAFLNSKLTPVEPQKIEVVPEDYEATKQERDEFKAKLAEREQVEKAVAEKAKIVAELQNKDNFGMQYVESKAADEAASMMAGMSPEQREWCMRNFRAFIAQINTTKLLGEEGTEGGAIDDPKAAFNALVLKYSAEKKVDYNTAFEIVKSENPELFTAWAVKKEK